MGGKIKKTKKEIKKFDVTLEYLLDIGMSRCAPPPEVYKVYTDNTYVSTDKAFSELEKTIKILKDGISAIESKLISCEMTQNNSEIYIHMRSDGNLPNVLREFFDIAGLPTRIYPAKEFIESVEKLLSEEYNKTLSYEKSKEHQVLLNRRGLKKIPVLIEAKLNPKYGPIIRDLG